MHGRSTFISMLAAVLAVVSACSPAEERSADDDLITTTEARSPDPSVETTVESSTTATPLEASALHGTVVDTDGGPVADAMITAGDESVLTGSDGAFELAAVPHGTTITIKGPVRYPVTIESWEGSPEPLTVELEAVVAKGLRVSRYVAADPEMFADLLALADETSVNTLVFDTKDEADTVLYATEVPFAAEIGAIDPVYDPAELLAEAKAHELYAVTRIVTFEDPTWINGRPEAKLAGDWVDAADRENWDYPLDLAIEACRLGFDEVQFDYVRFPAGRTAQVARHLIPPTSEERAATIAAFLSEARTMLHAEGCGVSAAVFGIVMSSLTDEGIGQTPETASAAVDALSPMLYPSHYGPGWLGFEDPNEHPGPVIAHALDTGRPKMVDGTHLRPWIQGFFYNAAQVQAQISEAESRGLGWIIWNASGRYSRDWLPSS